MKFQSNCNCNRLHLHVIDPNSDWHGSIISQILIGLCAPRLNSIKCLVSLQYEQYSETFNTYWFNALCGDKKV